MPEHKKPKFNPRNPTLLNDTTDDPEEDPDSVLDLDEIGAGARKNRRGAVKVDVYESDTSGDEKPVQAKDEDDDDDMFGGDEEKEKKEETKGKKKVNFVKLEDIAGQEFEEDEDKDESGDSDDEGAIPDMGIPNDDAPLDDEGVPLPRASKKDPKMTGFNLKDDMEEGAFDEDLNFVRKTVDAEAVHDNWLVGMKKSDIKKAAEAHEAREKARKEKEEAERKIPTYQVLSDLISYLERGETPLEALARLQSAAKRKRNANGKGLSWREKKKLKKAPVGEGEDSEMREAPETKPETEEEKTDRLRVELIEKITEATDRLLTRGQREIYEETRESLMRQYARLTGEEWVEPKALEAEKEEVTDWEYRWTDGRDDGQIYGPYPAETMRAWEQHGFFAGPIEFRRVGSGDGGWSGVPGFST